MTLPTPARIPFFEPTRAAGHPAVYVVRYLAGILVLVAGAALLIGAIGIAFRYGGIPDFHLPRLIIGYVLVGGGWFILPGSPVRAAIAAPVALVSSWLYLAPVNSFRSRGPLLGSLSFAPDAAWVLSALAVTGVVAAWFLVRRRPPLAYVLLPIPFVATAIVYALAGRSRMVTFQPLFDRLYADVATGRLRFPPLTFLFQTDVLMIVLPALLALLVIIVPTTWLARILAPAMGGNGDPAAQAQRLAAIAAARAAQQAAWQAQLQAQAEAAAQADAAWRVAEITRWEDAYAQAHGGERPPPGWSPPSGPGAPPPGYPPAR